MKKILVILSLILSISFSANATTLCGDGLRYVFDDKGTTFAVYNSDGKIGEGTYLFDHKGNIRIIFNGSTVVQKFIRSEDAFYFGDSKYTICD